MDQEVIKRVQAAISAIPKPPPRTPLSVEELKQEVIRGNEAGEQRPKYSPAQQRAIVKSQRRWAGFCERMGYSDWVLELKKTSFETKGIIDSYVKYLLKNETSKVTSRSSIHQYMDQHWTIYRKYTGRRIDERFFSHVKAVIAKYKDLRNEPLAKSSVGPDAFLYLSHFRWVRDNKTTFRIGLDRLDDATLRQLQMFTGARTHELVLAETADPSKIADEYYDKQDYYWDDSQDNCTAVQSKVCPLCDKLDDRTSVEKKVLCWEDIEFWIVSDPEENGGRDYLAMTVFLRFHKGHTRESRPTKFVFVEDPLPVICPVSHILAKAIAKGVIENDNFHRVEQLFQTRIFSKMVQVRWKDEFLHVPVFRKTVKTIQGFAKSNKPFTRHVYDKATKTLGLAAGLLESLSSYDMRRGIMAAVDQSCSSAIRRQVARHKRNGIYDRFYANTRVNVVTQDAFLGRSSKSPYLAIFNQLGIHVDENAPMKATDEMMQLVPPSAEVTEIKIKMETVDDDNEARKRLQMDLKAANQRHQRTVVTLFRKHYFKAKNDKELDEQLLGIQRPKEALRRVEFGLPERQRIANILGDLDDQVSEERIVQRKIEAIEAWVAYAWKSEIKEEIKEEIEMIPISSVTPSPTSTLHSVTDESNRRRESTAKTAPEINIGTNSTSKRAWHTTSLIQDIAQQSDTPVIARSGLIPVDKALLQQLDRKVVKRKPPPPCIFCGMKFTRTYGMWEHVEVQHLKRRSGEGVPCPLPDCRLRGDVFENTTKFKAHVYHEHNVGLRPDRTDSR